MDSFRLFLETPGAFNNTGMTNLDSGMMGVGHSLDLPTPTLDPPTRTIRGKVNKISYTTNPISIALDDGTNWEVSKSQWDYLKKIGREPKEGSMVQLELYMDGTIKAVDFV